MDGQRGTQIGYNLSRELVEDEVAQHIGLWAAAIGRRITGLKPKASARRRWSTPAVEQLAWNDDWHRFARFFEDMTEALHKCINTHVTEQIAPELKLTRLADVRKNFQKKAEGARTLAGQLRAFAKKYVTGQPTLILRHGHIFDPAAPAQDLDAFASFFEDLAADCRDRGGPTRKILAFDALAEGLIRGYSRATKRKGTGGNVREGRDSRLRDLVDAVLPTASKLVLAAGGGKPLRVPATSSLGDRLNEIAKRIQKKA